MSSAGQAAHWIEIVAEHATDGSDGGTWKIVVDCDGVLESLSWDGAMSWESIQPLLLAVVLES